MAAKKTVKKITKTKAGEYMVVKTADIKTMTKAYNTGYRRVGTYQGGAVAVLRNPELALAGTTN